MAVTPSGRIIAIYDARADFDDLPGPIDLVIRFSDNNGTTWSRQEIFRKHEGISGFGDASIVIDPSFGKQGRIIVLYQQTQQAGFFESTDGTNLDNPFVAQVGRSVSDDEGKTWIHSVITKQIKDGDTFGIFATSGTGGRITFGKFAGRLLQTFVLRRGSELLSAIGYSDNHGEDWQLGALILGGNETAIAGLSDGSVLVHSRSTPHRLSGISLDGGDTLTSLGPHIALPDPSDNGSLCALLNGELVCTHNHDSELRRNLVIKRSTDNGISWTSAVLLDADSCAYSTSCELSDGNIGILYERNAYQEIVFAKVSPNEFKAIDEVLPEITYELDIEFTIVPRYIRSARDSKAEEILSKVPRIPEVDMGVWKAHERKEVGKAGGTSSGDLLLTTDQLDKILGPVVPGLQENDEIRFSARIANHGKKKVKNLILRDRVHSILLETELLKELSNICILDIRQTISKHDLSDESAHFVFELSGAITNPNGAKDTEFKRSIELNFKTTNH
jgi:sialidase-1